MLGHCNVMAFLATTQPARSRAFYTDTLGLDLVADEEYALVFHAGGTVLRVQKVESVTPPPFTVLGWHVPDIAAHTAALAARGIVFDRFDFLHQDADGVWVAPGGTKVAWFRDPDGNRLSLSEGVPVPSPR